MNHVPDSPYKGLIPYSEEDAPFFFGREAEQEIIAANLMASRLTVLYGASGVGKSSVLRAGVAHHLRRLAKQNLAAYGTPEFAVVVFSSWRDDPLVGLVERVKDSVSRALDVEAVEPVVDSGGLADMLEAWAERAGGELFIILDQFEEYFFYHPQEEGEGTFFVEFPRAVNRSDLRASFLISIREDGLAKLDRFKGRIPRLFDNYYRVEHLDREAAREAVEKPIEMFNRLRGPGAEPIRIEDDLVDAVLEQVKTGRVVLGEAGRGTINAGPAPAEARIETPFLQLVMTRLWEEEMAAGSPVLRLETLERLRGAEHIVRTHLDAVMDGMPAGEQRTAAHAFRHLVTPSGTKIAHSAADLAEYAQLPEDAVAVVLERLSAPEVRILRPVAPPPGRPAIRRFEIFHDVLAPAILDWRSRYEQQEAEKRAAAEAAEQERAEAERQRADLERQRVEEQARAAKRLGWLAAVLAIVLLLAVGALGVAAAQRTQAQAAEAEAMQNAMEAQAAATEAMNNAMVAQDAVSNQVAMLERLQQSEATAVSRIGDLEATVAQPCVLPTPEIAATPTHFLAPGPSPSPTLYSTATPDWGATATDQAAAVEEELNILRVTQTALAQPYGPEPTTSPTGTPVPRALTCVLQVDSQLAGIWDRDRLGCPTTGPSTVWAAWQPFERGYMGWRSDTDSVYVFHFQGGGNANAGRWQETPDEWRWPTTEPASGGLSPPAGLYEPVRGFGWLWRTHLGGPDSEIGWATDSEKGFCATIQSFEQGLLFRSDTVEFCEEQEMNWATHPSFSPLLFALYGDGTWRRY